MDTIKLEHKGSTCMIAHRGLSGIEQENTCAAFVAAGNRSHYGIETDVHITADGGHLICHDDWTGRVAEENLHIEETPFDTLRAVKMKPHGNRLYRSDIRFPELAEYIEICKVYGKVAVLELKCHMQPEHIDAICEQIRGMDYLEQTVFISFDWDNLVHVRAVLPEQRIQFLTGECPPERLAELRKYRMGLDIYFPAVTQELVEECHANGVEVNCWTVDNPADAERLIGYGVDYITSNILE